MKGCGWFPWRNEHGGVEGVRVGRNMFLQKSLTISDDNVPLKSGRDEAGGNTEELWALDKVRSRKQCFREVTLAAWAAYTAVKGE